VNKNTFTGDKTTKDWSFWRWLGECLIAIVYGICSFIIALAILTTILAIVLSNCDYFQER